MKKLLIVYHSQSGASFQLACSAREGVLRETGIELMWRRAWDAGLEELQACHAVLLVAAENSGTLAGGMKDFLDRTFYPALHYQFNHPYAVIVAAGNDGRGAVAQMQRILSAYPMKAVAEPLICRGEIDNLHQQQCEELGQTLAAGLDLGIY